MLTPNAGAGCASRSTNSRPADANAWVDELTPAEFEEYERRKRWVWDEARPEQLTPPGDWKTWLYLAGRGAGKTRSAAEDVSAYGLDNPGSRIAVVAETFGDGRDICVEGESGLLSVIPERSVAHWNRSLGELVLENGTRYKLYSGDRPNQLRGPQHNRAWCDELAKFLYAEETWTQLQLGLRLGDDPRCVVTTTPRAIPLVRRLVKRENTVVTSGSTFDNAANLAESFLAEVRFQYEGTKLGDQELYGMIVELDGEAIFDRAWWLAPQARYRFGDPAYHARVKRRFQFWDTAFEDDDAASYTACVTLDLLDDYRLAVREAWRKKMQFPELEASVVRKAEEHNQDGLLSGVVFEKKASAHSLLQTLRVNAPAWLRRMIGSFTPPGSKDEKNRRAAMYCAPGLVLLPEPGGEYAGPDGAWLVDFTEELWSVPNAEFRDLTDAYSLGIIRLERYLAEAYRGIHGVTLAGVA